MQVGLVKKSARVLLIVIMLVPFLRNTARAEDDADELLLPLVQASAKRISLAREVALSKWDSGAPVEDVLREGQVIDSAAKAAAAHGLDEQFVRNFFRAQIEANKTVQYGLLTDWYRKGTAPVHSPIDLKTAIRSQLDELEVILLGDLKKAFPIRASDKCHAAVAIEVERYLAKEGKNLHTVESLALDRSLASFCDK